MENTKFILENTKHWISNCDSKVSYLLTINGIIITIIFTSENAKYLAETIKYLPTKITLQSFIYSIEYLTLVGFLISLIISLYFSIISLKGRIKPNEYSNHIDLNDSKIYWDTISKKSPRDYFSQVQNITDNEFKSDLQNQIYINSKICSKKFKYYNHALTFTSVAYILLIIFVFIKIKNLDAKIISNSINKPNINCTK